MDDVTVFPVDTIHLALYLQYLGNSTGLRAAVEEAVYALAWIHQVTGLPLLLMIVLSKLYWESFVAFWHCPLSRNNQSLVRC